MVKPLNSILRTGLALALLALPACHQVQPTIGASLLSTDIQSHTGKGDRRTVIGRIYDDTGMPVTGVMVSAKMVNPADHFVNGTDTYAAKVDQGDYGLANLLPPCSFDVTVNLPGFVPETKRYDLTVGGAPVVRGPIFNLVRQTRRTH